MEDDNAKLQLLLDRAEISDVQLRYATGLDSGTGDLAEKFVRALGLLHDARIKLHPGTKLLSKYAIVVADDEAADRAVAVLHSANVSASKVAA